MSPKQVSVIMIWFSYAALSRSLCHFKTASRTEPRRKRTYFPALNDGRYGLLFLLACARTQCWLTRSMTATSSTVRMSSSLSGLINASPISYFTASFPHFSRCFLICIPPLNGFRHFGQYQVATPRGRCLAISSRSLNWKLVIFRLGRNDCFLLVD